jgi:integrase
MATTNTLSDAAIRKAKPGEKPRKLSDGGGLYLELQPNGGKWWRLKYRIDGKEKRIGLGTYPEVSLADARKRRDESRALVAAGTDPSEARKAGKVEHQRQQHAEALAAAGEPLPGTFEHVAREFHAGKAEGWSASYAGKWLTCCTRDLFPRLGALPLADITAPKLLEVLRLVEARGTRVSAHDLRQYAGQVFRYGIQTGHCERNPAADLAGALKPAQVRHMAAVLEPVDVGALLRNIGEYAGHPVTRAALALSALLFQRPGNVRAMEWSEIDPEAALWTIPAAKMKRTVHGKVNGRPHLVPLAGQALAILEELRPLTGRGRFVFPSLMGGGECMSENTIRAALRRMGYTNDEMTAHGFRAMARTLIVERLPGIGPDVIEAQLAHGKAGPLGMAYDRAEFMDQRRQMMQTWADYLGRLRDGAQVIPFKAA